MAKTLDVFVSYRRSNGSQLASLLKVRILNVVEKGITTYKIPFVTGASAASWFLRFHRRGAPGGGQI